MAYVKIGRSLPRSLDVQISLSRAATETRTDLSLLAVCLVDSRFLPNAERVRFYSTIEAVEDDFPGDSEAVFAASAFFAQTPHPSTMAIGAVFDADVAAGNVSSPLSEKDIEDIAAIGNTASMQFSYILDDGGVIDYDMLDIQLALVTTITQIAEAVSLVLPSEFSCEVRTLIGGDEVLYIVSTNVGDGQAIFFPTVATTGDFIGDALRLTKDYGGRIFEGYTPLGITDELTSIANAANQVGKFIYGWTLGESLRITADQAAVAAWVLSRTAVAVLTTNNILAISPTDSTDLGSIVYATDNRRAIVVYHDNPQSYPDVSILAYMFHVNYQLENSTVTAKFKQLPGIETVLLSETAWSILQSKGYNSYTAIGNDSRTYRDGITSGIAGWYMDTVVNLDNFLEDLSISVFNVFLRNKKIPYTRKGQMLLVDACQSAGVQYTYNGTFADRIEFTLDSKSGQKVVPAVQVIPSPVSKATAADRAARQGPPIQMIVQESGAIHSTSINVELVQ